MLSPTYVTEVAPKEVRGRITGLFQVCLTVGIAISYWIVYGVNLHFGTPTQQWRIPMGFQVAPVGLMFILLFFYRESPRWLARHNQEEQSLTNLAWFRKLPVDDPRVGEEFTEILATVKEERESRGPLRQC
ncbi:general substrate transporter [Gautieria morchelliformis]|nr:general substrate transporter [Gautieria morchelliformis]